MESLNVGVRIRPLNSNGRESGTQVCATATSQGLEVASRAFDFSSVFDGDSTQRDIMEAFGAPHTEAVLDGLNSTIFASGQTGSGKTHTVIGDAARPGLLPNSLAYLFETARNREEAAAAEGATVRFTISAQCFEIYQEKVYDILSSEGESCCDGAGLRVRQTKKGAVFIENITTLPVASAEAAVSVFAAAAARRAVSATAMNSQSSRSHCIFKIIVDATSESGDDDGITRKRSACFNLVDLAGSERIKTSGVAGAALKEAQSINASLSELSTVIRKLDAKSRGVECHIPYRNSKLTFLLQDSLGGNARTSLIATVSPSELNLDETLSTLRFACHAKNVKTKPTVTEETDGTKNQLQAVIAMLRAELAVATRTSSSSEGSDESTPSTPSRSSSTRLSGGWGTPIAGEGCSGSSSDDAIAPLRKRVKFLHQCIRDEKQREMDQQQQFLKSQAKYKATEAQLAELKNSVAKRCLTLKMVIKFRNATIKNLEKKQEKKSVAVLKSSTTDLWAEAGVGIATAESTTTTTTTTTTIDEIHKRIFEPSPTEIKYRVEVEALEAQVESLKDIVTQLSSEEIPIEIKKLRSMQAKAKDEIALLLTEKSELEEAKCESGDKIVEYEQAIEEKDNECVKLEANLKQMKTDLEKEGKAVARLTEELKQAQTEFDILFEQAEAYAEEAAEYATAAETAAAELADEKTKHAATLVAIETARVSEVAQITSSLIATRIMSSTFSSVATRQATTISSAEANFAALDAQRLAEHASAAGEVETLSTALAAEQEAHGATAATATATAAKLAVTAEALEEERAAHSATATLSLSAQTAVERITATATATAAKLAVTAEALEEERAAHSATATLSLSAQTAVERITATATATAAKLAVTAEALEEERAAHSATATSKSEWQTQCAAALATVDDMDTDLILIRSENAQLAMDLSESIDARAALNEASATTTAAHVVAIATLSSQCDTLEAARVCAMETARTAQAEIVVATASAVRQCEEYSALQREFSALATRAATEHALHEEESAAATATRTAELALRESERAAATAREAELGEQLAQRTRELQTYAAQLATMQSSLTETMAELEREQTDAETRADEKAAHVATAEARFAALDQSSATAHAEVQAEATASAAAYEARIDELEAQVDDTGALYNEAIGDLESQRVALVNAYTTQLAAVEAESAAALSAAKGHLDAAAEAKVSALAGNLAEASTTPLLKVAAPGLDGLGLGFAQLDAAASAATARIAALESEVGAAIAAAEAADAAEATRLGDALTAQRDEMAAAAAAATPPPPPSPAAPTAPPAPTASVEELTAAAQRIEALEATCVTLRAEAQELQDANAKLCSSSSGGNQATKIRYVQKLRDENQELMEKLKRQGARARSGGKKKKKLGLAARSVGAENSAANASKSSAKVGKKTALKKSGLEGLKYRELQRLSKGYPSISGNMTKAKLLRALSAAGATPVSQQ